MSAPVGIGVGGAAGVRGWVARLRSAAWLGWQIDANWTDPFIFVLYSVVRPLGLALILAGMYWAVAGGEAQRATFLAFWVANAFHEYVTRMVVAMGWVVIEEREEYETLKHVFVAPVGMFTYLIGRSAVKFSQASLSVLLILGVGWFMLGLTWDWTQVAWAPLLLTIAIGLVAVLHCGLLIAGAALLLPRNAMAVTESTGVSLYLLSGVIFPIDLLPRGLQEFTLVLPFAWWYEAIRRFLLGYGSSERLSAVPDAWLLGALAGTTLAFSLLARWGYARLERRARTLGRIDETTLF